MKKSDRTEVHAKYNGHCAYCGKPIALADMRVDHIKPKRKGGQDALENYNPSCRRCNHYKRSLDLEGFREYIKALHGRIAKDYIVKVGMDYGIVRLIPFDGKFYFEKIKIVKVEKHMEYKNPIPSVTDEYESKQYSISFTFEDNVTRTEACAGINLLIQSNGGIIPEDWVKMGNSRSMRLTAPQKQEKP